MKNCIVNACMLLCCMLGFAQGDEYATPAIIPQTPEVASLLRYSEVPVSYYNGIPNVGVPIYTLQGRELAAPISLSYHAGGHRVNEEASWAGLGWSLSAGGQISRTIRGFPDDSSHGYINNIYTAALVNQVCNSFSTDSIVDDPYQESCGFYTGSDATTNRYDYEPDDFNYSMLGQSGRFMFNQKRDVNIKGEIVQFPNKNVKIEPTFNGSGRITGWAITDTNGILYNFEQGNVYYSSQTFQKKNGQFAIPEGGSDQNEYTETWNLTKITSPGGDVITFEYDTPVLPGFETSPFNEITTSKGAETHIIHDGTQSVNEQIANYSTTSRRYQVLSKITSSKGYVEFVRATTDREDMQTQNHKKRLQFIRVFDYNANQLQEIELIHDYFVSIPSDQPEFVGGGIINIQANTNSFLNKRLRLNEVIFRGMYQGSNPSDTYRYEFGYNTNVALPHKRSNAQDHWGYYNGATNNTTLVAFPDELPLIGGANRAVNPAFSGAYMLNRITYPEGAVTTLQYENNRGDIKDIDIPPYMQRETFIKALHSYTNTSSQSGSTTTYKFHNTFTISNEAKPSATATNKTQVSYTGFSNRCDTVDAIYTAANEVCNNIHFRIYNNTTNALLHTSSIWDSGFIDLLKGETYKIEIEIEFVGDSYDFTEHYSEVSLKWLDENTNPPNPDSLFDYFGGLRIQAIKTYDKEKLASYKSYEYNGGYILSTPEYFAMSPSGDKTIQKLVSQSWVPLITTQSGYVGYRDVKEKIHAVAIEAGYSNLTGYSPESREIVRSFSYFPDAGDYSIAFPGAPFAFDWTLGSILREEVVGKSISETGYRALEGDGTGNRQDIIGIRIDGNFKAERYSVDNLAAIRACINDGICDLSRSLYRLWPGQLLPNRQTITSKEGAAELVQNTLSYYESVPHHHFPTKTVTTDSKGDTYETIIRYPYEENHTQLLAENRLGIPLNTKTYKGNTQSNLLQTAVTAYAGFTGSDPTQNPTNVLLQSLSSAKSGGILEERVSYHDYTPYGQVREVSKTDGTHITYLWGYNYNYPVAKIENATYAEVSALIDESTIQNLTGTALTNALAALRTGLPNAMVSTYTFDPMIGMTSSTDPRGRDAYFQYDSMGRLQYVIDHDGHVVSQNAYHYKNN